jgi:RHS repeat-associated protein
LYDSADRPSTAIDSANGITYAAGFDTSPGGTCSADVTCYTPQGTFYALSIGETASFTGLNLIHTYNSRLQPLEFKASSAGGNAIDISYNFVDPVSGKNAGHVYGITNNLDSTRSQTFTYDQLNRISSALTTSTHTTSPAHCWGETYGADAWGNLQSIAATTNSNYTGCAQESGFTKTADGNNHLSGFSFDASGNTQNDGTFTYNWDAESQLKSAGGVTYAYDGDGRRVAKVGSKLYWYGSGGDILAETDASGNTTAEYIFFGGKRVAMLPATGNPIYYVEDLLGTSRVITTNAGVVCYDADFYPYGGERPYTNACPQNYKFEGKERDSETSIGPGNTNGNDDFGARYYSNRFGRWLSADWSSVPVPVPYANLTNPQTLNLYAMVADDPESFADLDGHGEVLAVHANSTPCSPFGGNVCDDKKDKPAQPPSTVKDTAIGVLKEAGNTLASSNPGTLLVGPPFAASNDAQQKAMTGTAIILLLVPGGGEEKAAAKTEEILFRQGLSKESVARLSRLAAEAEEKLGVHGVSTWNRIVEGDLSKAARAAVEKAFKVKNTGPPGHRTVILPKPVTQAVADAFNRLFGRIR